MQRGGGGPFWHVHHRCEAWQMHEDLHAGLRGGATPLPLALGGGPLQDVEVVQNGVAERRRRCQRVPGRRALPHPGSKHVLRR